MQTEIGWGWLGRAQENDGGGVKGNVREQAKCEGV